MSAERRFPEFFLHKLAHEPCILGLEVVKYRNDCEVSQETDVQKMYCSAHLPFDGWQFSTWGRAMFWFGWSY